MHQGGVEVSRCGQVVIACSDTHYRHRLRTSMTRRIVLVGEVIVDVTLPTASSQIKLRMGGLMHAARALWALGVHYDLAYFCPEYLDGAVREYADKYGARRAVKIGNVFGAPNVMLIGEIKESGSQGYEHLLRDEVRHAFEAASLGKLLSGEPDVLIIGGDFNVVPILRTLRTVRADVHYDLGNGPAKITSLGELGRPLATLFLSTSAREFDRIKLTLPHSVKKLAGRRAECVVLKENRGGSRCHLATGECFETGAQRREITHSVGVGDAFDAVFVAMRPEAGAQSALSYSSWIASDYASTTFPSDFKRAVTRTLLLSSSEINELPSVRLAWENRDKVSIYIAGPDFDYVDTTHIDDVVACLEYHNFRPRRPVKEHGQANRKMLPAARQKLYEADMKLLGQCKLMIAVNIFDDPGTLIEIGIAIERGMKVFLYDPNDRARNIMLTQGVALVTNSLDAIVTATFDEVARLTSCP